MPPQQIPNVSQPNPGNQYDFIVNSNHHASSDWLMRAPLKTRAVIFGGGLAALFLIIWIFLALIGGSGSASTQNFEALTKLQFELARISTTPSQNADTETTQNLASTVRLSLLTDELDFVGYLNAFNAAPSNDTLLASANKQTDLELQNAQANGTYDQTYTSIVSQELDTYAASLKRAFNATSNVNERLMLSDAYQHAQLLDSLSKQSDN